MDISSSESMVENYHRIDGSLERRSKKVLAFRIVLGFLFLLESVFLCLYFCLPCFQIKSLSVTGNDLLTREDVLTLSSLPEDKSLLFYSPEELNKNLTGDGKIGVDSSLVLESSSKSGVFSGSVSVVEDIPFYQIGEDRFFKSGKTKDQYQSTLSASSLSVDSRFRIANSVNEKLGESLLHLYLPETLDTLKNRESVMEELLPLSNEVLPFLSGAVFTDTETSSSSLHVLDVLVTRGGDSPVVLLQDILYDSLTKIFPSYGKVDLAMQSVEKEVRQGSLSKLDYSYPDGTVASVYPLHVSVTSDSVIWHR